MADLRLAGIDIGGTKIGVSIGELDGTVLGSRRIATAAESSPDELLAAAMRQLADLCHEHGRGQPAVLGIAAPGPLDYRAGRLLEVPNMPRWHGFALGAWLDRHAGCPAEFMNDANAGVLAEATWGAARGATSAVFLTMSTGMGAGLWLDGRVYEGPSALAGEVGHLRLSDEGPIGFGKRGSAEGWCSGPGIVQLAEGERLRARQLGLVTELASGEPLTPERVCALAQRGDAVAREVIDRCGAALGRLCAVLVDLLNPEVIVFGTIGSAWFELFEPRARAVIDREALPAAARAVSLRASGLARRGDQSALAIAARRLIGPTR